MLQGYPGGRYCEDVPSTASSPDDNAPAEELPDGGRRELRIAYVPGVTPGKWIRRWEERMPDVPLHAFMHDGGARVEAVRGGSADMAFVRLPVEREGLSVIPLYEEQAVVVAPKGHEISVFEDVALADFKPSADPDGPQFPHLTMTPEQVAELGITGFEGGFQNLILTGPDGALYTLAVRPLLPHEAE